MGYRFLFMVQGEGRGHMTQAIALSKMLRDNGHTVVGAIVGTSEFRQVPPFFFEKIGTTVYKVDSPNFVKDKTGKGISLFKTFTYNLVRAGKYLKSLQNIHQVISNQQPDVIINFYELLGGVYAYFYRPKVKIVSVGHQFLHHHPNFKSPKNRETERNLLLRNNAISSYGSMLRLAISFSKFTDMPAINGEVVPPLLREEVFNLNPENGDFILVYLLNDGYSTELIDWHKNNSDIKFRVFWDKKDAPQILEHHPNLTFYRLQDKLFLESLASCKAYMSTAGFESICEAMYFGKPVFLVPTAGHYEQACNLIDASEHGAGIGGPKFDFDTFIKYLPEHKTDYSTYKTWVQSAYSEYLTKLEKVASGK